LTDPNTGCPKRPLLVDPTHCEIEVTTSGPTFVTFPRVEQTRLLAKQAWELNIDQITCPRREAGADRGEPRTRGRGATHLAAGGIAWVS
jgi:hypothetical protein